MLQATHINSVDDLDPVATRAHTTQQLKLLEGYAAEIMYSFYEAGAVRAATVAEQLAEIAEPAEPAGAGPALEEQPLDPLQPEQQLGRRWNSGAGVRAVVIEWIRAVLPPNPTSTAEKEDLPWGQNPSFLGAWSAPAPPLHATEVRLETENSAASLSAKSKKSLQEGKIFVREFELSLLWRGILRMRVGVDFSKAGVTKWRAITVRIVCFSHCHDCCRTAESLSRLVVQMLHHCHDSSYRCSIIVTTPRTDAPSLSRLHKS